MILLECLPYEINIMILMYLDPDDLHRVNLRNIS